MPLPLFAPEDGGRWQSADHALPTLPSLQPGRKYEVSKAAARWAYAPATGASGAPPTLSVPARAVLLRAVNPGVVRWPGAAAPPPGG